MLKYKPIYWYLMGHFMKLVLKEFYNADELKVVMRNAKKSYRVLLNKADDIGHKNPMASNLYGALFFLAFPVGNPNVIDKELLVKLIEKFFSNPTVIKFIKSQDYNKPSDLEKLKKSTQKSSEWAEKNRNKYPDTWKFQFDEDIHKDGYYYEFTICPIAKFCKEYGYEDYGPLFCNIDYITLALRNAQLYRDKTIAMGDNICDFWIVPKKISNPK